MTTKAPPKKADPLVKVAEAEAGMTEAQEAAEAAGLKLAEATERVKALQQEQARASSMTIPRWSTIAASRSRPATRWARSTLNSAR